MSESMVDRKLTSYTPEEDEEEVGDEHNHDAKYKPPATFFSALEGTESMKKYITKFDV
jgi:hypothetical protein